MTRTSHAILAVVAAFGFASSAQAADLYTNYNSSPGFMAPAASGAWEGAYVGAFAGYGWGTVTDEDADLAPALPDDTLDASGWLLGVGLGANFAVTDGIILGAVGDIAWSGINGYDATADLDYDVNWLGSLRARAGYDAGAFLPYLTAGLAVAGTTAEIGGDETSEMHFGWTAGAGVEVAVTDQMSVDLQYRYSDYGMADYDLPGSPTLDLNTHTVSAGINYKF